MLRFESEIFLVAKIPLEGKDVSNVYPSPKQKVPATRQGTILPRFPLGEPTTLFGFLTGHR